MSAAVAAGGGAVSQRTLYGADIVTQLQAAIVAFFTSIWNGIQSFFGAILSAISNTFATIFSAPVGAITSGWVAFQNWSNQFGPIAPLLTALMVGLVFAIGAFFLWLIIRFSVSQLEETGQEVEEGV